MLHDNVTVIRGGREFDRIHGDLVEEIATLRCISDALTGTRAASTEASLPNAALRASWARLDRLCDELDAWHVNRPRMPTE